jgi:hypothetical protein
MSQQRKFRVLTEMFGVVRVVALGAPDEDSWFRSFQKDFVSTMCEGLPRE